MGYDLYPAIDENYNLPPEVRTALSNSLELRNDVEPMTTATRNNLLAGQLWDGRVIANTTTDHLERYDAGTSSWEQITQLTDLSSKVDRAGGTMTADPTVPLGVVTKQYADLKPKWTGKSAVTTVPNADGTAIQSYSGVSARDITFTSAAGLHTMTKSGLYIVTASTLWSGARTQGQRQWLEFEVTGGSTNYRDGSEENETTASLAMLYPFTAGGSFIVVAYQTSGVSRTVTVELAIGKVMDL